MGALILFFLLGCVAGLRSMMAPAIVCWAAHFGWLNLTGTKLAFVGHPATLILFTLLAAVELVLDKLPKTPARTEAIGLAARVVSGGLSGAVAGIAAGTSPYLSAVLACAGAVAGAFAGYNLRRSLVQRHLPDLPIALVEDVIAIVGGLLVTRWL